MALEVKIFCKCGSKYKFDVIPVNQRLPGPVSCPVCRLDGTDEGNRILAELLHNQAQTPMERVVISAEIASGAADAPKSPSPNMPRNAQEYAAARQAAPPPVPAANQMPAPPLPASGGAAPARVAAPAPASHQPLPPQPPASALPANSSSGGSRLTLGIVGALATGVVGCALWYFVLMHMRRVGAGAWIVGALIGYGALFMAKKGTKTLGFVAGAVALVVILLGQALAGNHERKEREDLLASTLKEMYDSDVALSKKAAAAKSDEELKGVIAEENSSEDVKVAPADVTSSELAEFKKERLPLLRKMANGTLSKADYRKQHEDLVNGILDLGTRNKFGLVTAIFLFLGVGTAFQVAATGKLR
jgi:hypothetical protein